MVILKLNLFIKVNFMSLFLTANVVPKGQCHRRLPMSWIGDFDSHPTLLKVPLLSNIL